MGGLMFPDGKKRKPAKPAQVDGPAFPKPAPKRPPMKSGQRRRTHVKAKRDGHRGNPSPAPQAFPKPAGRAYDTPYLLEVKRLPCKLKGKEGHTCDSRSQADHAGPRPRGRKCDDRECIPMCHSAHVQRTECTGYFKGWDKVRMKNWCGDRIAEVQAKLARVPVAEAA